MTPILPAAIDPPHLKCDPRAPCLQLTLALAMATHWHWLVQVRSARSPNATAPEVGSSRWLIAVIPHGGHGRVQLGPSCVWRCAVFTAGPV